MIHAARASLLLFLFVAAGCTLPRAVLGSADGSLDAAGIDAPGPDPDTGVDAGPPPPDTGADAGDDAGSDAGDDAGTPPCTSADDQCASTSTLRACVGGVLRTTECALACAPAPTPHCRTFDPINVTGALTRPASPPDVTLSSGARVDTGTCSGLGTAIGAIHAQDVATGPEVCLFEIGALSLPAGQTLVATGSRPLVIVAYGAVTIGGIVDLSSYSSPGATTTVRVGAGAASGGNVGVAGSAGTGGVDAGGGGGGLGGAGGDGASMGSSSHGGAGGAGSASQLAPLVGGANGGDGSSAAAANGGAGGGALQITSFVSIQIDGTVAAAGAGGLGGGETAAGGGGGSGGGVVLEAPTITLGTGGTLGVVVTVGGGGGGSGGCGTGMPGTAGADGATAGATRAAGAAPACSGPHEGGAGGGGTSAAGSSAADNGGTNGSGGGGGAGVIAFRTLAGTVPAGTTSPASGATILRATLVPR